VTGRELLSQFQGLSKLVAAVVNWVADQRYEVDSEPESRRSDDPLECKQRRIDTTSLVRGDGRVGGAGPFGQVPQ
jgi:hypothetical protein